MDDIVRELDEKYALNEFYLSIITTILLTLAYSFLITVLIGFLTKIKLLGIDNS